MRVLHESKAVGWTAGGIADSNSSEVNPVQPANAFAPMFVISLCITTLFNLTQPANVLLLIAVTLFGNAKPARLTQFSNADAPITSIFSGIVISEREPHPLNVDALIAVTASGISNEVILEQPLNAPVPMTDTLSGSSQVRIRSAPESNPLNEVHGTVKVIIPFPFS